MTPKEIRAAIKELQAIRARISAQAEGDWWPVGEQRGLSQAVAMLDNRIRELQGQLR